LEKTYANELSHLNSIHNSIFQNVNVQLALLDGKSFKYKIVNDNSFPPELKNWIIDKDDDEYIQYIGLSPSISHVRFKNILLCKESKQSVKFNETIRFINGQTKIYKRTYTPIINDDNIKDILMIGEDITKEIKNKKELELQLKTDILTGAYNRLYIENKINEFIKNKTPFTIMFIDIDNFKNINDTYGHSEGDVLLTKICSFFKGRIQQNDFIGRLGGDEFIIFFNNLYEKVIIEKKIKKLYSIFKQEITKIYKVTLSIGISIYPSDCLSKGAI